ncbi:MAG TPA: MMPL family transporter [Streptosporangiaceae bacterium]|nr:MMPL family transporter [Streptosporangiaceae bacterium]
MTRHFSPAAIGRWSIRHPVFAITVWIAFVLLSVGLSIATGSRQLQDGSVGQSARGDAQMQAHMVGPGQAAQVYLHSASLRVTDGAFKAAIAEVSTVLHTSFGGPVSVRTAADRHTALLVVPEARMVSPQAIASEVAGFNADHQRISAAFDDDNIPNNDLQRAEKLSVPVTLLVLLMAFGALVAALVPVLLAVTAVVAAFGLLGPISHLFPLSPSVKTVVLLIGMAVGVDYALFYVIRSREERNRGLPAQEALERTARTSGRTVVIAGSTVAAAMAGQFAIGSDVFNGIASGTIAVIACAVAGSVTVLPALLRLLGRGMDAGVIPFLPHLAAGDGSRFWPKLVGVVLRRPVLWLLASAAVLIGLALPAAGMHLALPSSTALAQAPQSRLQARIDAQFPSASSPAVVVVTGSRQRLAAARPEIGRLESLAAARGIAHPPFTTNESADGTALTLALPLTGLGDNPASRRAIAVLRDDLIPATLGHVPGVRVAVTGDAARDVDFTAQMRRGLPLVIGIVLLLAFCLLLVTFRSVVVPVTAIALNLLSVGASFGVLVLVFQQHWAQGLLGFQSDGSIIAWLPVFLFVVLFGLSMDYHVFILSRVREGIDHGLSNDEALRSGITKTAGVVTSAALVMFGVFSLFGTASALDLKQAGVGLAVAVLLDATLVRAVLLPAAMKVLGRWNWYLPSWLDWLPGRPGTPALPARPDSEYPTSEFPTSGYPISEYPLSEDKQSGITV